MLRRGLMLGLLALAIPSPAGAQPKSWTFESDDPGEEAASKPVRFSPRFNLWVARFDRPPRACRALPAAPAPSLQFLREEQLFPGPFCNNENSDELAIGSGVEFAFRVFSFVYLTAAIDILYTEPDTSAIKNQLVVALPFGVMLTYYEWFLRPILYFEITPVLYVTDDARDYTLGGGGGLAYRILRFGSISFTAGYHFAETLTSWQLQLAVHPLF